MDLKCAHFYCSIISTKNVKLQDVYMTQSIHEFGHDLPFISFSLFSKSGHGSHALFYYYAFVPIEIYYSINVIEKMKKCPGISLSQQQG